MGSGCEKDQTELPRSSSKFDGDNMKLDNLRLQSYTNKDEIHVHDDKNNKVFIFNGRRRFQLGMDSFLKNHSNWMQGVKYIIKGERKTKLVACNLVLEITPDGWTVELESIADNTKHEHYVILCDPIIHVLDEFTQRL